MIGIIVKRLIQGVPTVFGVTLITFILFNVVGGDPVTHYLGKSANPKEVELMKKEYGLDQPLINQYTDFLEEVVTFDFGRSYRTRDPVSEMLLDRIGPSLSLTLPALVLTTLLGIAIALLSTYNRGRAIDRSLVVLAVAGMSISFSSTSLWASTSYHLSFSSLRSMVIAMVQFLAGSIWRFPF